MNKKEIAEIKRQINGRSGVVQKIAAFFVTTDKRFVQLKPNSINLMSEEEQDQYFGFFKHVLSGREGSTLHNLEFTADAEKSGNQQDMLLKLRSSQLSDSKTLDQFLQLIGDNYDSADPYFVLLMYGCHDIAVKSEDASGDSRDSEEVFSFIVCGICPAKLSKKMLSYSTGEHEIKELDAKYIIPKPDFGFVFPAFNERSTDIHALLAHTKKSSTFQSSVFSGVLGCQIPLSEAEHIDVFSRLTDTAFGGSCSFTEVAGVHMSLNDEIQKHQEDNRLEPLKLDCNELASVLEENYATDIDSFKEEYEELLGAESLIAENLVETKNTTIKTESFKITMPTENLHLVSIQEINGIRCLVIKPNDSRIEIDGIVTEFE